MNAAEAIRAEIAELYQHPAVRRMNALVKAFEILDEADAAPAAPDDKPRAKSTPKRNENGTGFAPARPSEDEIAAFVASHPRPVTRKQVLDALGGKANTVSDKLQRMRKAGKLVGHGRGASLRYSSPPPRRAPEQASAPASVPPGAAVVALLAAIRDHGPVVAGELRRIVGRPVAEVLDDAERLRQRGLVAGVGSGASRLLWAAGQPRDLKREVLALVAYAPGEMNETRLLRRLDAQFEEVVDVVAALVAEGHLRSDDERMLSLAEAER